MPETKEIILIADPLIYSLPVIENNDPIIDLKFQNKLLYAHHKMSINIHYTKIRKKLYEKILQAQDLLPNKWKFCVYEGYRSIAIQERFFNYKFADLLKQNPTWQYEQLLRETIKLVSPVINKDGTFNTPPHSTGGAVDLYIVDENKQIINMGLSLTEVNKDVHGKLSSTESDYISDESRKNRKIMCYALRSVGLVNYATEYWHWSYGDKFWAYHTNAKHAIYDTIQISA